MSGKLSVSSVICIGSLPDLAGKRGQEGCNQCFFVGIGDSSIIERPADLSASQQIKPESSGNEQMFYLQSFPLAESCRNIIMVQL